MSRPVEPFIHDAPKGVIQVGAKYADADGGYGPIADVYLQDVWLRIVTDRYEGSVMLHAEALPLLIKALQRLQRRQRLTHSQDDTAEPSTLSGRNQ